uniref:Uncharacterized protein n=1 Tax=Arundo donax TaxID=35708 RepID=A0A0A8YRM8_ARUDO
MIWTLLLHIYTIHILHKIPQSKLQKLSRATTIFLWHD